MTSAEAIHHFDEALRLHGGQGSVYETARTRLLLGELLRRERRRSDARVHLRAALQGFQHVDAQPWARRAAGELRAAGETSQGRDADRDPRLTPQELQIARLVGGGGSNKEIAAQLFLSPRTVEYHLSKVFTKLGIASRSDLIRRGLGDPVGAGL